MTHYIVRVVLCLAVCSTAAFSTQGKQDTLRIPESHCELSRPLPKPPKDRKKIAEYKAAIAALYGAESACYSSYKNYKKSEERIRLALAITPGDGKDRLHLFKMIILRRDAITPARLEEAYRLLKQVVADKNSKEEYKAEARMFLERINWPNK